MAVSRRKSLTAPVATEWRFDRQTDSLDIGVHGVEAALAIEAIHPFQGANSFGLLASRAVRANYKH
jgi:hypothetical protein